MSMYDSALILGNGASRKDLDLEPYIGTSAIYGCNLAYQEDIPFEWIVSTDPLAQHDVYRNFKGNKLFLDWNPIPSQVANAMMEGKDFDGVDYNEFTPDGAVISGQGAEKRVTYCYEDDNVLSVFPTALPFEMASGSMAMWDAAERGFKTIYLSGMGDKAHLTNQTLMDDQGYRLSLWKQEREQLVELYKEINWIYL